MDDFITRKEYSKENTIVRETLLKHERSIVVLETLFKNFEDLPNTLASLDKTVNILGENIKHLNEKFDITIQQRQSFEDEKNAKQDKKLAELDEKTKIDFVLFLKNNWFKIILGACAVMILFKDYIKF